MVATSAADIICGFCAGQWLDLTPSLLVPHNEDEVVKVDSENSPELPKKSELIATE